MSIDITLEHQSEPSLPGFGDYSLNGTDRVARAIAIAVNDPTTTTAALTTALRRVQSQWDNTMVAGDPDRYVFEYAIAHVVASRAEPTRHKKTRNKKAQPKKDGDDGARPAPLFGPACAVAYFGLAWPVETISTALQLSPEAVEHHLELARTNGFAHQPSEHPSTIDVRSQINRLLDQAEPTLPNLKRLARQHRWSSRRNTMRVAAAIGAVLLVAVVLFAQLVQRPDRVTSDEPAEAAPQPAAVASAAPQNATAAAGEIGNEPRPDMVPLPDLIATDGRGGFVGVRSSSPQNAQVVFTRSEDGENWSLASNWNLGPGTDVTRFERSGDYFMAWIDGVATTSDSVVGTVGISRDLIAWTVVELAIDDGTPRGLIYDTEIADLLVSGNNILALVTTNVEINFGALSLSEGYTCGQTISDDEVLVKLCNDAELDVLSLSNIAVLPKRNRLFVSRGGLPFEQIEFPFDDQTAARLTTVNSEFAITDETGIRIAISPDAITWQTITAGKPPFAVRAAAADTDNQIVGIGDLDDGELVVFHNGGKATNITTTTAVEDLVGPFSTDVGAVAAAGPDVWVIYLFEPETRAWLFTSHDGIDWSVLATSPPVGTTPRLLVGNNEALLQWTDSDGAAVTIGVPLP